MNIKLPFGLRDGKLIHISEVNDHERGLRCNCICPECGMKLVAKLGNKKIRHFSHSNENCKNAFESAIHILAKDIIAKHMKIKLPKITINCIDLQSLYISHKSGHENIQYWEKEIVKEAYIEFDRIELEKRIDNIIPDIVVYKKDIPLLIEIAVTHFIDTEKMSKIKKLGISTLEINLSKNKLNFYNFDKYNFDKYKFEKIIIDDLEQKQWIYNRRKEKEEEDARLYFEKEDKRIASIVENENIDRFKKIKSSVDIFERKAEEFKSSLKKDKLWLNISKILNINEDIPEFINCEVQGEWAFNCDRRVWQGYIFTSYILNRKGKIILTKDIIKNIIYNNKLCLNKDLISTKGLKNLDGNNEYIPDLTSAIFNFLSKLQEYGFLQSQMWDTYNMKAKYLVIYDEFKIPPPNCEPDISLNINTRKKRIPITKFEKQYSESAIKKVYDKFGVCRVCNKETNDWTIYYGGDGTCLCRECSK